jgi:ribosome-associated toxin RatA of RatAB toxin-antitoxin module
MSNLPAFDLGPMPTGRQMSTVDEQLIRAPLHTVFGLAADVERWPSLLPHYRYVRFTERRRDGGGVVDMSANRPFGIVQWPTYWRSKMQVVRPAPGSAASIRFVHVAGVTTGMDVEWTFREVAGGTQVRIVHVWDGPDIPVVGSAAATMVIGPVFVHGIASRTLAGLAAHAERAAIGAGN